jgi:hypothetical protein
VAPPKKAKNALGKGGASSGHITKLEQSRLSLDIYASSPSPSLEGCGFLEFSPGNTN